MLFFLAGGCFACGITAVKNNAEIKFEVTEIDFGELQFKSDAKASFSFTNPGSTPLTIQHVKTSCGCTVPHWPTKPIKPGKSGEIKINYDTSQPGMFQKTITVFFNGKNSPETLIIKGRIDYSNESIEEN